jgi:hypothetical protein
MYSFSIYEFYQHMVSTQAPERLLDQIGRRGLLGHQIEIQMRYSC